MIYAKICPEGLRPFGAEIIHSHPKAGTYRFSEIDSRLQGAPDDRRLRGTHNFSNRWQIVTKESSHEFSEADLGTSGYLVTTESPTLYHHDLSKKRIRLVSTISTVNDNIAANISLAAAPKGANK